MRVWDVFPISSCSLTRRPDASPTTCTADYFDHMPPPQVDTFGLGIRIPTWVISPSQSRRTTGPTSGSPGRDRRTDGVHLLLSFLCTSRELANRMARHDRLTIRSSPPWLETGERSARRSASTRITARPTPGRSRSMLSNSRWPIRIVRTAPSATSGAMRGVYVMIDISPTTSALVRRASSCSDSSRPWVTRRVPSTTMWSSWPSSPSAAITSPSE
jgi:hypothetical protein